MVASVFSSHTGVKLRCDEELPVSAVVRLLTPFLCQHRLVGICFQQACCPGLRVLPQRVDLWPPTLQRCALGERFLLPGPQGAAAPS